MSSSAFLLALTCGLLLETALGSTVTRRQSCNVAELPAACRHILDTTIDDAAYEDPNNFIDNYCNATCAEPLYDYFRECEPNTDNATRFDFFCSSNSDGDRCLSLLQTAFSADDSFPSACVLFDGTNCSSECQEALVTAYDSLGCCLFTFYAVVGGETTANSLFRQCIEEPTTLCPGGASGGRLQFPVAVEPQCEEFVRDVDESCRSALSDNAITQAYGNLDQLCSETCGPEVYRFYEECDQLTGTDNASLVDVLCATNSNGERCGDHLTDFSLFDLDACSNITELTCPTGCREAIQQATDDLGCCLPSLIEVFSGIDFESYARFISSVCDVNIVGRCVGNFSGKPAPPAPEPDECSSLEQILPEECRAYTSIDTLSYEAFSNPSKFKAEFCSGNCSDKVYEYFDRCDMMTGGDNASVIDFLCSQSDSGATCASLLSISQLDNVQHVCSSASDGDCSLACSAGLHILYRTWGCCLSTFLALESPNDDGTALLRDCGIEVSEDICKGGISDRVTPVTEEPTTEPVTEEPTTDRPVTEEPTTERPTSRTCDRLFHEIPADCRDDIALHSLLTSASTEPDKFYSTFCQSNCAKPVYDYINECVNSSHAAYIDFLCSESTTTTKCANILSDERFLIAQYGVCEDLSDKQCSEQCHSRMTMFNAVYGCCLFSYSAITSNVTYSNDVWDECGEDSPGLCTGGISNAPISAPAGDDADSGALGTLFTSVLLLIPAYALATLI